MWALAVTGTVQEALALMTTPVAGEVQGQLRPLVVRGFGERSASLPVTLPPLEDEWTSN